MVQLSLNAITAGCLDDLVIRTPCPMDWDRMDGDGRRRFCSRCEKQVYNIAAMTRSEAIELISGGADRICARVYRRPDGTVVTRQCPSDVPRSIRKPIGGRRFQFSIATLVALLTSSAALFASAPWIGKKLEPLVQRWFGEEDPAITMPGAYYTVGAIEFTPDPAQSSLLLMPAVDDPSFCESPESAEVNIWGLD